MKINIKNFKDLCEFSECMALLAREESLVGFDVADFHNTFSDTKGEIEFHVAAADTFEEAYNKFKTCLSKPQYDSAVMFSSVKQGLLDTVKVDAIVNRFVDDYCHEDTFFCWALYEPNQEEICKIYIFCAS